VAGPDRAAPGAGVGAPGGLFLRSPGVQETKLPASEGQTFHFRYRNLRLLIHGKDRMFLVADRWSASSSTVVVPLDGSVRGQFPFQNQHP
jgi:hypothetical protein